MTQTPSTPPDSPPGHGAKPVIVYDGQCEFCRAQIRRIQSMDPAGQFDYRSAQSPGLIERFPQLAGADVNEGLRLVAPDGAVAVGSDAVYEIARLLPVTGWLTPLYRIPPLRWISRKIYSVIARNRFRLRGKCNDQSCDLD